MASLATLIFLVLFSLISSFTKPSTSDSSIVCFGDTTLTRTINYMNNVSKLLNQLVKQANSQPSYPLFFNTSLGKHPNRINSYYICWGHTRSLQKCRDCVEERAEAISWDSNMYPECSGLFGPDEDEASRDECLVNYSNNRTGYVEGNLVSSEPLGGENITDDYNRTLTSTIDGLIREAALGNWSMPNYATRVSKVMGSRDKIYILVQCTPDISALNCSKCLGELYPEIHKCCNGTQGGTIVSANCFMKYNHKSFFRSASVCFMPSCFHVYLIILLFVGFLYN